MINGQKVQRPTKEVGLPTDIATHLGIPVPYVSEGGSVDSRFIDDIHVALTGKPTGASVTYRRSQVLLETLGLSYDPVWDSSESAGAGGGTVTTRTYSRVRTALTGVPRCFLAFGTIAPNGRYYYDSTTTGTQALDDAGPASRVIFYSSHAGLMAFRATGTVAHIGPGRGGPRFAELYDVQTLPTTIPLTSLQMTGWPPRGPRIDEVTFDTYEALLQASGVAGVSTTPITDPRVSDEADADAADPGGLDLAERQSEKYPVEGLSVSLDMSAPMPAGVLSSSSATTPTYTETGDVVTTSDPDMATARSRDKRLDRLTEERAVAIVKKAMASEGWTYTRDRQKDGCGYDLEFEKGAQLLKVEIKGIRGGSLVFDMTPKEWWRAETDDDWVLVAVTRVLTGTPTCHFLTRDKVVAGSRKITGYRVRP